MGINTQGFFNSDIKTEDIEDLLNNKFNVETKIENTGSKDYKQIHFTYKDEKRMLSVFENYPDKSHTGHDKVTLIDLNFWGKSVEIIRGIVEEYGGYMVEDDCSDEWFYVNKIDQLFSEGKKVSERKWNMYLDDAIKNEDMETIKYLWSKKKEIEERGFYRLTF
jgi:hypothetical protein